MSLGMLLVRSYASLLRPGLGAKTRQRGSLSAIPVSACSLRCSHCCACLLTGQLCCRLHAGQAWAGPVEALPPLPLQLCIRLHRQLRATYLRKTSVLWSCLMASATCERLPCGTEVQASHASCSHSSSYDIEASPRSSKCTRHMQASLHHAHSPHRGART